MNKTRGGKTYKVAFTSASAAVAEICRMKVLHLSVENFNGLSVSHGDALSAEGMIGTPAHTTNAPVGPISKLVSIIDPLFPP